MDNQYNPKSCNPSEKENYTPIEAAIRWCELIQYEQEILKKTGNGTPGPDDFPQWPCLRINLLKILSAIPRGKIEYALDGIVQQEGCWTYPNVLSSYLSKGTLTIHRNALKYWISENYPDQKSAFLFDEIERKITPVVSAEGLKVLQFDYDTLKANFDSERSERNALIAEKEEFLKTIDDLTSKLKVISNKSQPLINLSIYSTPWLQTLNATYDEYGKDQLVQVSKISVEDFINRYIKAHKLDISQSDVPLLAKFMRLAEQREGKKYHAMQKAKNLNK